MIVSLVGHAVLPPRWRSIHPGVALLQAVSAGVTALSLGSWLIGSLVGTRWTLPTAALLAVGSALWKGSSWWCLVRRAGVLAARTIRAHPLAAAVLAIPGLWRVPALLLPVVDSDGLRYHVALPKLYLLEGRVFFNPWDVSGAYPQGAEMINLLALQIGPAEAAKWLHFGVVALGVAGVVMMVGRRHVGSFFGALAYAATPAVLAGAGAAFIDGFAVLHIAVAALALRRRLPAGAVGLALAGGMWTKWTVGPAAIGCLVVLGAAAGSGRRWRALAAGILPAILVLTPLMVRNTVAAGDPTFPMLTGLIHGEVPGVEPDLLATVSQRHRNIPGPLGIPWGRSSGAVEPDEIVGWHHLVGLVLLVLLWRGDRRVRIAAALVIPYLVVGFWFHPSVRLAMPMFWALGVVEGIGLTRLSAKIGGPIVLVTAALLLPDVGGDTRPVIGPYLGGETDRAGVLHRLVPGAEAAEFVNEQVGGGRVMALDFPAPALFDRRWIAEGLVNLPPLRDWLDRGDTAADLLAECRRRDVEWLIVTPGYGGGRIDSLLPLAVDDREGRVVLEFRRHLDLVYRRHGVDVWRLQAPTVVR